MRVLVCGGRRYDDYLLVRDELDRLMPTLVIHGGCATRLDDGRTVGADHLADVWARRNNVCRMVCTAEWAKLGRAAGPIRNQEMLDRGKPQLVLAFPGGRGTADMTRRAVNAGIEVVCPRRPAPLD